MSNFINDDQIKTLESKDWDVRPEGFYITIYPENMNSDEWEQVCQQADVDTDVKELTVLAFGVKR